jgi:hypothetical protein
VTGMKKKQNSFIENLISLIKFIFDFSKKESQEYEIETSKFLILCFLPGGVICWKYFYKIGYLPELDIQSMILLLSGTSILGWLLFISIPSQYRTKDCKRLPGKGFMRITTFQA